MSNLDVSTQSLLSSREQFVQELQVLKAGLSSDELVALGKQAIEDLFS